MTIVSAALCLLHLALVLMMTTNKSWQDTKLHKVQREGDYVIGALFPVHRQPSKADEISRKCSGINEQYGIQRVELMMWTLDKINKNPNILPNVTLGWDIRDTCWFPPIALEQSVDFITYSIASDEGMKKRDRCLQLAVSERIRSNGTNYYNDCSALKRSADQASKKTIVGLIGPGSSDVTRQVQTLLDLFKIPMVSYSATSSEFSNKNLFSHLVRVVPSDTYQAQALVDIVKHFEWKSVWVVYTKGSYGANGMNDFKRRAKNICIMDNPIELNNNADYSEVDQVIQKIHNSGERRSNNNVRVIVCFCWGETVNQLLHGLQRHQLEKRFVVVASDGWNVREDVVEGVEDVAVGGISIKLYSPSVPGFDSYYHGLNFKNNTRNHWFNEFWQERFNCSINGSDVEFNSKTQCTGREDLKTGYHRDNKLGLVVNAIYSLAYAIDTIHRDVCRLSKSRYGQTDCQPLGRIKGQLLKHYLLNLSFTIPFNNDTIEFDQNGDIKSIVRYEVMQFQRYNGKFRYTSIGNWSNGYLCVNDSLLQWPQSENSSLRVRSYCSKDCAIGSKKVFISGDHCCWNCEACPEEQFVGNETYCVKCPLGNTSDENRTGCVDLPIENIELSDASSLIVVCLASAGALVTAWVMLVFGYHHDTPIVKASSRELTYVILLGIILSYVSTIPLVISPSPVSCCMGYVTPPLGLAVIYGGLATRTNRIVQLLSMKSNQIRTKKLRCLSAKSQLATVAVLFGIELIIVIISSIVFDVASTKHSYEPHSAVLFVCNDSTQLANATLFQYAPFYFNVILLITCTLYAYQTRNLPENFNETKFIAFTMYTTWVIWLAFVPINGTSNNERVQIIAKCLAVLLSATVALVLLYLPKVYVIVRHPERNVRSAFTTSTHIRCHVGFKDGRAIETALSTNSPTNLSFRSNPLRAAVAAAATMSLKRSSSATSQYTSQSGESSIVMSSTERRRRPSRRIDTASTSSPSGPAVNVDECQQSKSVVTHTNVNDRRLHDVADDDELAENDDVQTPP